MSVQRLNHAVLYVGNVAASVQFYTQILGMEIAHQSPEMPGAVFLRAAGSANDHDLGLFEVGAQRPGPAAGRRGLYHLAWQVDTIDDLLSIGQKLSGDNPGGGSMVGMSDHGASKSLYAVDPDGIEIEIMWAVPRADWPTKMGVFPLSLDAELAKWSGVKTGHEANV
jgi:catechol-2,3-dioxygenase